MTDQHSKDKQLKISIDVSAVPMKPAGAGLYIWELVKGLVQLTADSQNEKLMLVARQDDAQRWKDLSADLEVHAVVPNSRPLRLVWEQFSLPKVLKDSGVDVHHGPHYTLPMRAAVPQVVTVHDMTLFDHPEWHEKSKVIFFRRAISKSVKHARRIIAVSNDTSRKLQSRFGELPVTVIPHGVDFGRFSPTVDRDGELLLTSGIVGRSIAFVGTLEPRKNVPGLIYAFNKIAEKFPDLRLVLAGRPGWGVDEVETAINSSPYSERIIRTGYLSSEVVPALLRQAEVVAYPSFEEGFGLPALEALACGAVLVTAKGSAMEEVAGEAALLVPAGDNNVLAEQLEVALTNVTKRDELKEKGPKVAAGYTWMASARAHLDVYRSVFSEN